MKKILAAALLILAPVYLFAATAVNAKKNSGSKKSSGIEFGIGSGYVFYGDSETKDLISDMNSLDFSRFIIGGDLGFFVPLADYVTFVAEAEIMNDLFWKGSDHCYFLDYSFNSGIKLTPGLGGLGLTVDYCLGRRTSFIKFEDNETTTKSTKWGNGFKFAVDYDILYEKTHGVCPVIGAYWRRMPRGNDDFDNTISIYLKLLFRQKYAKIGKNIKKGCLSEVLKNL